MAATPEPHQAPTHPLDAPVETLSGVGGRTREKLARLGVIYIRDLLFLLPLRYLDRTRLVAVADAVPGAESLVEGVVQTAYVQSRRRRCLMVRIEDDTGTLLLRHFHFNYRWQRRFASGRGLRCFGVVREDPAGCLEMIHPQCESFDPGQAPPLDAHLTPVYPSTMGLGQAVLRRLAGEALRRMCAAPLPDYLGGVLDEADLPSLHAALQQIHAPLPDTAPSDSIRRLALEELLTHRIGLLSLRRQRQQCTPPPVTGGEHLVCAFLKRLPFRLTAAQQRCCEEICANLKKDTPMTHLLQGDVGCGKTVVAAAAAVQVIGGGGQVALMVPTELLARQHYKRLCQWFEGSDVPIILQTGSSTRGERRQNQARLAAGTPLLAVGTHALIQQGVSFKRLGLAIIDEQHRFGVCQRLELLQQHGTQTRPHQLVMTATPIPRTLYMTLYAGLSTSMIDELPPGRKPVCTAAMAAARRDTLITRIREACRGGRQVYWVCGLVEDSETLEKQSVAATFNYLRGQLPELSIGIIHGRLKAAQKEAVMCAFQDGEIDLLVTTTVVEVGIDVQNANLMVIENSECLGLSQLHQLRGRIGRGDSGGDCILLYASPLSKMARARLKVMRAHQDGFHIAEEDLRLRGPGELLGELQTGVPRFRCADLARDAALLPLLTHPGNRLLNEYPEHVPALLERWLGETGQELLHA